MDVQPRSGPPRRDLPTWLVGLAVLLLAATAVLWPLLTGQTLTEWMRDLTGALGRR